MDIFVGSGVEFSQDIGLKKKMGEEGLHALHIAAKRSVSDLHGQWIKTQLSVNRKKELKLTFMLCIIKEEKCSGAT